MNEAVTTLNAQQGAAKCAKCGADLPQNAKFCLECGEKVAPPAAATVICPECGHKFITACPKCGATVSSGKFCPECGEKL